jgi:plasmid stabilization system protein ParE
MSRSSNSVQILAGFTLRKQVETVFVPVWSEFAPRLVMRELFSLRLVQPLCQQEEADMPQGDKSAYTDKQKRKAEHIEEGYEDRGVSTKEAERRAWATVNKESGGGNKSGSGRGKEDTHESSEKGGRKGAKAAASRSAADRSAPAKKAAQTRKRNEHHTHH